VPRIAIGGYIACCNSFVCDRQTLDALRSRTRTGDAIFKPGPLNVSIRACADSVCARGAEAVALPMIVSGITGPLTVDARQWALAQFTQAIRDAMPVDGVFVQLHGTGCADDEEDIEGELLAMLRDVVGSDAPIVVALDGHANVSARMHRSATALLGMKTNPHVDYEAIGAKAGNLLIDQITRKITIASSISRVGVLASHQPLEITPGTPMQALIDLARDRAASDPRILDITIAMGLFVSDREDAGMQVIVTTDDAPALGQRLADEIAQACRDRRQELQAELQSVEDAVANAIGSEAGPVILGDLADSIFHATPGDGTALLAELIRRNAQGAVVPICDPDAVRRATEAGVGGRFSGQVGGKIDDAHGKPVAIDGEVRSLHADGRYTSSPSPLPMRDDRGPCAVVAQGGVEIVLTSRRAAAFEPEYFRSLGIEPLDRHILVCKTEMQHRPGFAGTAKAFIDVDGPGLASQRMTPLPFRRVKRPIYPLDQDAP